jgi:hypothetical protein
MIFKFITTDFIFFKIVLLLIYLLPIDFIKY